MGCTRTKAGFKSAAILEQNKHLWADSNHCCQPINMATYLTEQNDRKARKMVADGVRPRTAHDIFFKKTADLGLDIGEYNKYRRQYSRWRGAYLPECVPERFASDFHYLYPSNLKKRWLLFQSEKVTGFSSDLQLRMMAEVATCMMDSTYGTAPVGFNQYLTIHALLGENGKEWQPVLMALMNGKEQKNYECIFDEIKNYWNTNNIKPKFGKILSDYEGALQNALLNFDDPKKVWGCTFHYSQALLRFVSKCGLMQYYSVFEKKDYPEAWIPIRTWIRSIMALPLLPIEERNFIWEKILKNPPAAPPNTTDWPTTEVTSKFVNYVETTWLTKPYNTWCFFGGGRVKNTNRSESWNSVISKLSDQKPKLNVFIHDQQLLFSKAEKRIEALLKGEKARDQEKKYKALVDRITAYEEEYLKTLPTATTEQQRIAINLRHLRRVQYLLHDIRNKSGATLKSKKKAAVVARGEESALWNADLGVLPETSETEPGNLASEAEIDNGEEDSGNDEIDAFVTADFDAEDLVRELAETFEEIEKSFATVSDNEKDAGEAEAVIDLAFQEDTPKATVDISDNDIVEVPHEAEDRAIVDTTILFQPPTLKELEDILKRLDIDPTLATNSPILGLTSIPVDLNTHFVRENVAPDGNCCWRSVSLLLTGTEEHYWEIRQKTFEELRYNADLIGGIKKDEVRQEYAKKCEELAKLKKGKVDTDLWGGTTELLGLASLLTLNIVIYNPGNGKPFFTRCSPVGLRYTSACPSIFLNASSGHYKAIVGIRQTEN